MKKFFQLLMVAVVLVAFTSCKSNMRRDVKRLTHKTEQCFSKVDINDPTNMENEEFIECYDELEKLMTQYDQKYSNPEQSAKFGKMYLEELQKSNLSDDFKDLFGFLYGLGDESDDLMFDDDDFDIDVDLDDDVANSIAQEDETV